MHVLQNTAQHNNELERLCTLCVFYRTQHNTVTHQNHSVHCACFKTLHSTVTHQIHTAANLHCACVAAQHSNASEPLRKLCVCYRTQHNTITNQNRSVHCACFTEHSTAQLHIRTNLYTACYKTWHNTVKKTRPFRNVVLLNRFPCRFEFWLISPAFLNTRWCTQSTAQPPTQYFENPVVHSPNNFPAS